MSAQRHRIRRQVLEIVLEDQRAAWQLSSELSRIQSQSLEAIIDGCCTEASDPDRLHRIETLVVDLGRIHPDELERELIERLGPRLREALVTRIREEDQATSLAGADPDTISRLELVVFFVRTGSLPWWADGTRSRLLDETVGILLERAARSLVAVVRTLARDARGARELRRLVLHCEDERLSALFAALVGAAPRGIERAAELRGILTADSAIVGILPSSFRAAVWMAVLRAASLDENAGTDAVGFWRGALAHTALELGVTYTVLVTRLHTEEPDRADRPTAAILQRLYREARGQTIAVEDVTDEADEIEALVDRLEALGIAPSALLAELLRWLEELEASAPPEAVRELRSLLRGLIERRGDTTARPSATPVRRDAPATDAPAARSEVPGELHALLDGLAASASLPPDVLEEAKRLLREALDERSGAAAGTERIAATARASRRHLVRALERVLEWLARAAASPPAQPLGEASRQLRTTQPVEAAQSSAESPPLDLAYGDSEDVYVENAGMVILWPFLGHLFERLELMTDKRFKDPTARHRAVGLLHYLATEDPWPQEYQLLLAKVLCGMKVDEVFDFGPPVTEAEATECADMLTAVIANAPILREMSTDGFRGSFLLRKGVLGTRDGAWLLRVERATHDVVLDRFPWSVGWVKLPWMEAPLSVEW